MLTKKQNEDLDLTIINSDFLNGLKPKQAINVAQNKIEEVGIGKGKINYRLRDAIFSRQRYWGKPFPVYYKDEIAFVLDDDKHVTLPPVDKYLPTSKGDPPLGKARKEDWNVFEGDMMETEYYARMETGSSWYFKIYGPKE